MLKKTFLPPILGLFLMTAAAQASLPEPVLVKNIGQGAAQKELKPLVHAALGDRVLMTGYDEPHGNELWTSDGTAAGTRLLKDILPGPKDSNLQNLTVSGNRAFFSADDGIHGPALWITDGTEAGTRTVAVIGDSLEKFVSFSKGVTFAVYDESGYNLWFSDGTATGTHRLLEGFYDTIPGEADWTQPADSLVYILRSNNAFGMDLWRTDGTRTGTVFLRSFPIGKDDVCMLGSLGKNAFFAQRTISGKSQIWRSDGTPAGTVLMKTVANVLRYHFETVDGKGYFLATNNPENTDALEVWVTDGTEAGTRSLKEATGLAQPEGGNAVSLKRVGRTLLVSYVQTFDGQGGYGLWAANLQTQLGNVLIDAAPLPRQNIFPLICSRTQAFFLTQASSQDPLYLWVTDGTPEGTRHPSPDFGPGGEAVWTAPPVDSLFTPHLVFAGSQAFFQAQKGDAGRELWKSDGTPEGTGMVLDLISEDAGAAPQQLRTASGHLYFSADDGVHGRELWRTDGTGAGTQLVADIRAGAQGSSPMEMTELNGLVYFSADDGASGRELWRTDGTTEGTSRVADLVPGTGSSTPAKFYAFKNRLYFQAWTYPQGCELWSTDGTQEGTILTANLSQDGEGEIYEGSFPQDFVEMDGWLYFTAWEADRLLFRTDGTPGSVTKRSLNVGSVRDLTVRPPSPTAALAPDQHVLYFTGSGVGGGGVWYCTNEVAPIRVHSFAVSMPSTLRVKGDELFFSGRQEQGGKIWRSNGTEAGTQVIVGQEYGYPVLLALTDTHLYYSGGTSTLISCGLDGGQPRTLIPDRGNPNGLSVLHSESDTLIFARSPYQGGLPQPWQIWSTQGTAETTRQLSGSLTLPIAPPSQFTGGGDSLETARLGSRLYFAANDSLSGPELYSLDLGGRLEVAQVTEWQEVRPLAHGAVLDLGFTASASGPHPAFKLRLTNTGLLPLTGLQIQGLPENTASAPIDAGLLAPGEVKDVTVSLSLPGMRPKQIRITATSPQGLTHTLGLLYPAVTAGQPPQISIVTPTRLVLANTPVAFHAYVAPEESITAYRWKQDTRQVGTSPSLLFPASLGQAGSYTLTATASLSGNKTATAVSAPMRLAIVQPAPDSVSALENRPLTLTCIAQAPRDSQLAYQWFHQGAPVHESNGCSGARSSTLKIASVRRPVHAGDYECVVTLTAPDGQFTLSHGITQVSIPRRPVIVSPSGPLQNIIGDEVSVQIEGAVDGDTGIVTSFSAKGLPPGLKLNSQTGVITGRLTRLTGKEGTLGLSSVAPYIVTVTATNAAGISDPYTFPWIVEPFLPAGTWQALPYWSESSKLGTSLRFTVTLSGTFSGETTHEGKTYRFTRAHLNPPSSSSLSGTVAEIIIPLPNTAAQSNRKITIGLLQVNAGMHVAFQAPGYFGTSQLYWNCFGTSRPAKGYEGSYTWRFTSNQGAEDYPFLPQGAGFMTATTSPTGVVTWKGKMADGTPVIGSSAFGVECYDMSNVNLETLHLPLHQALYPLSGRLTGALHGWITLPGPEAPGFPPLTVGGSFRWSKSFLPGGRKDRLYQDGFALDLEASGGKYLPPVSGELLLNLEAGVNNALLTLSSPAQDVAKSQTFTLTDKHKALFPHADVEHPLKTLTVDARKGTFKGTLAFPHPTDPKLNRSAIFEGVILPHQGTGAGFFLLADLPAEGQPASALKATPVQSGLIGIGAP